MLIARWLFSHFQIVVYSFDVTVCVAHNVSFLVNCSCSLELVIILWIIRYGVRQVDVQARSNGEDGAWLW